MTNINISNPSARLSKLFREAAGVTDKEGKGLSGKGLQIADALVDPNKKIALKGAEVDRLLAHVEKLPEAQKTESIELLDYLRDRFSFDSETSAKKLLDTLPKTATPIEVGGRVRSVQSAKSESVQKTPEASAKDIKETDAALDEMKRAGGEHGEALAGEAATARKTVFDEGDIKASPEGGRKAYVESTAKHSPMLDAINEGATSLFFEDRLVAFLMKNGMKFMEDMNEKMAQFDDPKKLEDVRASFNDAAKKMLGMADRLSPDGKARVAQKLSTFLKANPQVDKELPAYKAWAEKFKASPSAKLPASASAEAVLKDLPPVDNKVIQAMANSDHKEVREFSAVFSAAERADAFRELTPERVATMSEDDLRKLHGEMKGFSGELQRMKSMLPEDVAKNLKDLNVPELPAQVDPTSRQLMFQQINVMMQQYQQIMQALSETLNKLNEMAMDPIRKMGR